MMFLFGGCSKSFYIAPIAQFNLIDTTEFRYKNSMTNTLYLPVDSRVCVVDKTKKLVKTKHVLERFIVDDWRQNATLSKECTAVDFYLELDIVTDLVYKKGDDREYFSALKLGIVQKKGTIKVADYTIKAAKYKMEDADRYLQKIIEQFAPLYLANKKIFTKR